MSIEASLVQALDGGRGADAADRLCEACVALLSVDAAAISLVFDGVNSATLGGSSDEARLFDELQFTFGEGPCLESVATRAPVLALDLGAEVVAGRWPAYGPALLDQGIAGVFAIPVLIAGEYVGALDLFRRQVVALDGQDLSGALVAAELAEMPLLDLIAATEQDPLEPGTPAWTELDKITRDEVSQATGMLVAQLDVDPAQALVRLRAHAYATNRSVTAVARDVLDRRLRLGAG
ncbi:GAF and ANTAR domain-containing protein [Microlunatus flavus]|uniref:GAF domain-containing protein n=1 Tax=Microlunatus flavus TaxID=1036181 RepID=A0A1H9IE35_9ACTN|nr:GAF and ANTAR domain-containing protein [Microlunatus flavus]SEQ72849.1 GAF domain-containing protein [Microlunatus flavus]